MEKLYYLKHLHHKNAMRIKWMKIGSDNLLLPLLSRILKELTELNYYHIKSKKKFVRGGGYVPKGFDTS